MGRKKQPVNLETSVELLQFSISSLFRLVQVLDSDQQNLIEKRLLPGKQAGERLEKILSSILELPDIQNIFRDILHLIEQKSTLAWARTVKSYLNDVFNSLLAIISKEPPEKVTGALDSAYVVLSLLDYPYRLVDFAEDMKYIILNYGKRILTTDSGVHKDINEIIKGLFTSDFERSLKLINALLIVYGAIQFRSAVSKLSQIFYTEPFLLAGIEFIEKERGWGGKQEDTGFELAWQAMRPKIMGRIYGNRIFLPGSKMVGGVDVSDEYDFAISATYLELRKRIAENPVQLFDDALSGKLTNSLILSIEYDLRDEIRKQLASRRQLGDNDYKPDDYRKYNSKQESNVLNLKDPFPTPENMYIMSERLNMILNILNKNEKAVVMLKHQLGLDQNEIAARLNKSQTWVSLTYKKANNKIRIFYRKYLNCY